MRFKSSLNSNHKRKRDTAWVEKIQRMFEVQPSFFLILSCILLLVRFLCCVLACLVAFAQHVLILVIVTTYKRACVCTMYGHKISTRLMG